MEYYGLRKAGEDIDFVISREDYGQLATLYPHNLKNLAGDLGVCVDQFELWTSICLFDYGFLAANAVESENYAIISLEKLWFLKVLAMDIPKYEQDVRLIVKKILAIQYGKER